MWYFSWILGVGLACTFGILNAIWYEFRVSELARSEPVRATVHTSHAEHNGKLASRNKVIQ